MLQGGWEAERARQSVRITPLSHLRSTLLEEDGRLWSQALGTSGQDYYRIWRKLEGAFDRLQESLINAPALDFEVMSVGALLPAAPSWTSPGRTAW